MTKLPAKTKMMTKMLCVTSVLALGVGCEHTKKDPTKDTVGGATGNAGNGSAAMTAPKPSAEMPKLDSDAVRPPTKDDLAGYLAKVPGTGNKLMALIETSMGSFHCQLYPDKTPMTVANFVGLATGQKPWTNPKTNTTEKGVPFFDGLIFHRVIPTFMIQGGDPLGRGMGGPGYNFDDEFVSDLTMKPGVLAMANAGPGTNGSQFFITEGSPEHLNGHHTIFGQCAEVDLVTKIEAVPKGPGDRPVDPVTITHVTFTKE
ncbi:MAG: peptidylprolyl isomerase [Proteobacteria bacterium]|nr:peptidylprolyl isomerase [Pseudomonadota bacterium]